MEAPRPDRRSHREPFERLVQDFEAIRRSLRAQIEKTRATREAFGESEAQIEEILEQIKAGQQRQDTRPPARRPV